MDVQPADRVLLLAMPPLEEVRGIAARLTDGLLVALLDADAVYEARRTLKDFANVMVAPADPEGVIPWKEEFFSAVYAPHETEPTAETLRVLLPGGTAWVAGGPVVKR